MAPSDGENATKRDDDNKARNGDRDLKETYFKKAETETEFANLLVTAKCSGFLTY